MKQAVAFIIDANPSMDRPFPGVVEMERKSGDETCSTAADMLDATRESSWHQSMTRLECAKRATVAMISELMLQSKTNEVQVIFCKMAQQPQHVFAASAFGTAAHLVPVRTELTKGFVRPCVDLLRRISTLQTEPVETASNFLQGDVWDAVKLASSSLPRAKLKYQRKIVLITNAAHDMAVDTTLLQVTTRQLRKMDCRLQVIGLDFESSVLCNKPANAPKRQPPCKRVKRNKENVANEWYIDGDRFTDNDAEKKDPPMSKEVCLTKADREKFFRNLTKELGGSVMATLSLQQILNHAIPKQQVPKTAIKYKVDLCLAPGVKLKARYSPLMSKQSFPTMRSEAVAWDDRTDGPRFDDKGREIARTIQNVTLYADPDDPDTVFDEKEIARAIEYGSSSLIPLDSHERLQPKTEPGSGGSALLKIFSYASRNGIPMAYRSGPPYVLTGHESKRACIGISALAQALNVLQKVAIGTFHKQASSTKPVLMALFPLNEPQYPHPIHLVALEIPFKGEIKNLELDSFTPYLDESIECSGESIKSKVCDELIESLMLPDDVLGSGQIPSPMLQSCRQTILARGLDPLAPVVRTRSTFADEDAMATPPEVMRRATSAILTFEATFPSFPPKQATTLKKDQKRGRKVLTYKDFLSPSPTSVHAPPVA